MRSKLIIASFLILFVPRGPAIGADVIKNADLWSSCGLVLSLSHLGYTQITFGGRLYAVHPTGVVAHYSGKYWEVAPWQRFKGQVGIQPPGTLIDEMIVNLDSLDSTEPQFFRGKVRLGDLAMTHFGLLLVPSTGQFHWVVRSGTGHLTTVNKAGTFDYERADLNVGNSERISMALDPSKLIEATVKFGQALLVGRKKSLALQRMMIGMETVWEFKTRAQPRKYHSLSRFEALDRKSWLKRLSAPAPDYDTAFSAFLTGVRYGSPNYSRLWTDFTPPTSFSDLLADKTPLFSDDEFQIERRPMLVRHWYSPRQEVTVIELHEPESLSTVSFVMRTD